jgi:branched-chain amino acid transport system ATP-binding protein
VGFFILVVEQFAKTALKVADYAAVMAHGQIMQVGEPKDIEDEVSAAYLGGAA